MKHRLTLYVYLLRATNHARGQEDLTFTVKAGNYWEVLEVTNRLRQSGYSKVRFLKVGKTGFIA